MCYTNWPQEGVRKKLSFDKFSETFCPEILSDLGAVNVNKLGSHDEAPWCEKVWRLLRG